VGNVEPVAVDPVHPQHQVLPAALNRRAVVLVTVSSVVMLAVGLRYAGEDHWRWLDETAVSLARDWFPGIRRPARFGIGLVDPLPFAVLIAVLAGACLALRRPRLAVVAVVGPVLTGVATTLLKPLFDRTKNGEPVYPSGHMGAATALALVAALLLVSVVHVRPWLQVVLVAATTAVVGAGMALAMTVTRYHYLTDAVGGFCTAVAVVLAVALLLDRAPPRHYRTDTGSNDGGSAETHVARGAT
jgi:undecaprenyl-diphosphatase